jgi:hypothetical protein
VTESSTFWQRLRLLRWAVPALLRFVFFGRSGSFYFHVGGIHGLYQPILGRKPRVVFEERKS